MSQQAASIGGTKLGKTTISKNISDRCCCRNASTWRRSPLGKTNLTVCCYSYLLTWSFAIFFTNYNECCNWKLLEKVQQVHGPTILQQNNVLCSQSCDWIRVERRFCYFCVWRMPNTNQNEVLVNSFQIELWY